MVGAEVTIVVVPRDRFSRAERSLARIYEVTDTPFDLVYVDGRSPRRLSDHLRAAARQHGFTLLREERYVSPNRARNLGLAEVRTPYVVFVDNDVCPAPGWLDHLLTCAKETGAWAAAPLTFEGDSDDEIIHVAAGEIEIRGDPGARTLHIIHGLQKVRLRDAPKLERAQWDFVEFHCVLMRTDTFERIGTFDEEILSTRDHLDLSMRISTAGGTMWFEPSSRVNWLCPPPVRLRDLPYFSLRWSDVWAETSTARFNENHGLETDLRERLEVVRFRRHVAFAPLQTWIRTHLGSKAERAFHRALVTVEPRVNHLLVRSQLR